MANTIHTVVKGDTLWDLARKYGTTVDKLVELNDIEDPNFIVIGQKLIVSGSATKKTNITWRAEVKSFGLLSNGTELYASWTWGKTYTENYQVQWSYKDSSSWLKEWIQVPVSTVTVKQATYSIPQNAKQVKFVVKPISKKKTVNGKEVDRWTASWSTAKIFNVADPHDAPSAPNIDKLEGNKLTVSVSNVDADGGKIVFQVYPIRSKKVYKSATVSLINRHASHIFPLASGSEYVVRCQVYQNGLYSEWSPYSSSVLPAPAKVARISTLRAESETSVYLGWGPVATATAYDIEYTTDKSHFGSSNLSMTVTVEGASYYLLGNLQSGDEYFFRVRAVNGGGESDWSEIGSVVLGTEPIAPTTWSSVTTAITGEDVTLFWVHNSEDGSNETYAEIEFTLDGVVQPTVLIENKNPDEDEVKTRSYILDTSSYAEGTKILWRVRTSGVTNNFGDWSIQRTIDVYAQPTLDLRMQALIGGRNLLLNSDSKVAHTYQGTVMSVEKDVAVEEWWADDAIRIYGIGGTAPTFAYLSGTSVKGLSDEKRTYAASVYVKNNHATNQVKISANHLDDVSQILEPGEVAKVELIGKGNGWGALQINFQTITTGDDFDITYWHPKIEYGSRVTDWIPAPEDTGSDEASLEEIANPDSSGELNRFPFYISAVPGPASQHPIGYYLTVLANESYDTSDAAGNDIYIKAGDAVYSKYFDVNQHLMVELGAGQIDLENNKSYTVTCTASMDSGLSSEASLVFQVLWDDIEYEPNAEIGIDEEIAAAYIRPYCEDVDGNPIEGVTLSVYRREFDGTFTELMTGIDNLSNTFITDPHPALDYARYRVVATDVETGAVSYSDITPYPVNEKAVIIQWDDDWSEFEGISEGSWEQPVWAGSLLRLPYNIDVTENNQSDVTMVKYIGRTHPVSYYGTQVGETATWNVTIEKDDEETLYMLRRLQKWMGDVYVREPSGCGYWANISVSFSQKHKEVTIPVTLNITRVEGGV